MKRPRKTVARKPAKKTPAAEDLPESLEFLNTQVFSSGTGLHDLFTEQTRQMLDSTDLDEQAKQAILVAMACPCCGTTGMNYTAKINRKT
jgi:hypothetical protein